MDILFTDQRSAITEGIRVSVRTAYLTQESRPEHEHYVFAYEITISNESAYRVQLMRRKWYITDALGRKRLVTGDGVIGQQPTLAPGESHTYVSGCDFPTPAGKMTGWYFMQRLADGSEFKARIPEFSMFVPSCLN